MVRAAIVADGDNNAPVDCCLYVRAYGENDELMIQRSPLISLAPGQVENFAWKIEDSSGSPIAEVGVEISSVQQADGTAYLD